MKSKQKSPHYQVKIQTPLKRN